MGAENLIRKERIHLYSPCADVCAVSVFNQKISKEKLWSAIENAVAHHQILNSRVKVNADGNAYLEADDMTPRIKIVVYNTELSEMIREQEKNSVFPERGRNDPIFSAGEKYKNGIACN